MKRTCISTRNIENLFNVMYVSMKKTGHTPSYGELTKSEINHTKHCPLNKKVEVRCCPYNANDNVSDIKKKLNE